MKITSNFDALKDQAKVENGVFRLDAGRSYDPGYGPYLRWMTFQYEFKVRKTDKIHIEGSTGGMSQGAIPSLVVTVNGKVKKPADVKDEVLF